MSSTPRATSRQQNARPVPARYERANGVARHAAEGAEEQRRAAKRQICAAGAALRAAGRVRGALTRLRRTQATVRPSGRPANRTVVFRREAVVADSWRACCGVSHPPNGAAQGVSRRHGLCDLRHRRAQPEGAAAPAAPVLHAVLTSRHTQVTEVAQSPFAEACWYLPQTREQFRLSGARFRAQARRPPPDTRRRRPAADSRPAVRRRRVA